MPKIILLGPPGTGKGTQAGLLCASIKVPHLCTGDMMRKAMADDTPTGRLVKPCMASGALVPDSIIIEVVKEAIRGLPGYVLDGFPRTVFQAEALSAIESIDRVVSIETPPEVIVERLSNRRICSNPACGAVYNLASNPPKIAFTCDKCSDVLKARADDNPEIALRRQQTYLKETAPLIDFYKAKGLLRPVDGTKPMEEVAISVMAAIC